MLNFIVSKSFKTNSPVGRYIYPRYLLLKLAKLLINRYFVFKYLLLNSLGKNIIENLSYMIDPMLQYTRDSGYVEVSRSLKSVQAEDRLAADSLDPRDVPRLRPPRVRAIEKI